MALCDKRGGGILNFVTSLIISRCDVTLGKGGLRNVTTCDKDERGVKKS